MTPFFTLCPALGMSMGITLPVEMVVLVTGIDLLDGLSGRLICHAFNNRQRCPDGNRAARRSQHLLNYAIHGRLDYSQASVRLNFQQDFSLANNLLCQLSPAKNRRLKLFCLRVVAVSVGINQRVFD